MPGVHTTGRLAVDFIHVAVRTRSELTSNYPFTTKKAFGKATYRVAMPRDMKDLHSESPDDRHTQLAQCNARMRTDAHTLSAMLRDTKALAG